jgi:ubiquinone/menaquinone biosynthesis C-methylase UbiE
MATTLPVKPGYNYDVKRPLAEARSVADALEASTFNYFHDQLGLTETFCRERLKLESQRTIPKRILDELASRGWVTQRQKILDVGAGQGGLVLELLARGADAYGVEPGEEFASVARLRLDEAGYDPARILVKNAESLPFADGFFDYVISLQVLEHVQNPAGVLGEIFRVLRPGGQFQLNCENYLCFREPHYCIPWLPLLPKRLGSIYLKALGRNPEFLLKYIYYTTFPQIWRNCCELGFVDKGLHELIAKFSNPAGVRMSHSRVTGFLLQKIPDILAGPAARALWYSRHLRNPLISLTLTKRS